MSRTFAPGTRQPVGERADSMLRLRLALSPLLLALARVGHVRYTSGRWSVQGDAAISSATTESLQPLSASPSDSVSTGLSWALVSLFLDIVEVAVLVEIIFFDKPRGGFEVSFGLLEIYFVVTVLATIGQAVGVYLVTRCWYRLGGLFQIVSSAAQVVKLDGIIGVIGGVKAVRYARIHEEGVARRGLAEQGIPGERMVPSSPGVIFMGRE